MRGHRLALGKEETHGIQGTIEARAEALLRCSGAQVQKWKGTDFLPHILERETFRRRKYGLQITQHGLLASGHLGCP